MAIRYKVLLCTVVVLVTLVELSCQLSLSENNRRIYNDFTSGNGLYNNDTKVVVLNATNFRNSVFGTKNAWLIEFYNSWCGFCQRFAPTWKTLAADVYGWREIIKIAALDCANDDNNPLCREYEIMHYPSLKFFSVESKPSNMGIDVEKGKNEDDIRHSLVELLKKEQVDGRGSTWPNITPYRSSDVLNLWKNAPEYVKFSILLFEDTDSFIGTEVILDLHIIKEVQIRSVLNQNEALFKLMGVSSYPSMVVFERNQNIIHLKVKEHTRDALNKTIIEFLKSQNIFIPKEEKIVNSEIMNVGISDHVQLVETEKDEEEKNIRIKEMGDVVFQVDLENTLQYSLKSEIPIHKFISGQALHALKDYLKVLAKYFPIGPKGTVFLEKLRDKVAEANELKGQIFMEYVHKIEEDVDSVFSSPEYWIGCKGSEARYRGYPCGLWTMFHTLTVNAVNQNGNDKQFNSLEVLNAMLGYVTHFFGCQDCSKHFQEMASKSMNDVSGPAESIMWLWKAHNQVNKRLSGDLTEDPLHPKIQFPSRETCPTCRNSEGSWIYKQVLAHLKHIYIKHNINKMGLNESPNEEVNEPKRDSSILRDNVLVSDDKVIEELVGEIKRIGWNFNIFDISLCVVLYVFSATILILVFIKFVMRKRYRKKLYIHDLLGKV